MWPLFQPIRALEILKLCEISWDLLKKYFHLKSNAVYNSSAKNKELPKKTMTLCYLDSNNKSLIKEHKYQTRHKTFPNLPRNANKTYINSFLCMGPKAYQTLPVETQLKTNFRSFIKLCKHYLFSHLTWSVETCWNKWKQSPSGNCIFGLSLLNFLTAWFLLNALVSKYYPLK